ncbi:MAG: hypothetical protein AUJ49_07685 [Desulfovibrionaceae bacterium CG1_02_65_16]|nr:MAG: hypothetical protein AUJ49_07685 [Desulfovibrionaceae bacterium CG1_02_65_16]
MSWIARQCRKAKSLRKNMKLAALARGGWASGAALALGILRGQGVDGLRRGLAVLVAQAELRPEEGGFAPGDYQEWVRRYDTFSGSALTRLHRRASGPELAAGPLFRLALLPGETDFWDRTLASLRAQVYARWELVAVAAAGQGQDPAWNADARAVLARHAGEDPRIRLAEPGSGLVEALALGECPSGECPSGECPVYVGVVRAGDELPPHALFCAALALRERPQTALLYADEDRLDAAGQRIAPWFKPDRNPELMLAQDMFSGLCLLRAADAAVVGGPRLEFGPWLAYDLAWRVMERVAPEAVVHVPRILCHRRGALDRDPAPGLRAAQEHLVRAAEAGAAYSSAAHSGTHSGTHSGDASACAVPAPDLSSGLSVVSDPAMSDPAVSGLPRGCVRAVYARPGPDRVASILIPTRDRADLLAACVRSIMDRTAHKGYEIIVIDNGSALEETFRLFDALRGEGVRIVRDDAPFNYSRLNNNGAAAAKGEFLCLMNNDIEVIEGDWLGEMLSFAARPDVGCVGARLLYPDGTLQHGGILRGVCGFAGHAHLGLPRGAAGYFGRAALHQEMSAVTAACLVVRRSVFNQVDGLDESLPESYNDVDFCLRVRAAGYRNVWTPYAELFHHESASRRARAQNGTAAMNEQDRRTTRLMRTRWGALAEDSAYNPNLTRRSCGFDLAWPPRVAPLSLL